MQWYDVFSHLYDLPLERLYRNARLRAVEALDVRVGQTVLDLPTGTGQSFDALIPDIGADGILVASDFSAGMLARAQERAEKMSATKVVCIEGDAQTLGAAQLRQATGQDAVDRMLIFLGMSVFPNHEDAFENLWRLLRPGGRCVIVDVHTDKLTMQSHLVQLTAQADVRRRWWQPLENKAEDFHREVLEDKYVHGGQLILATGVKPQPL